MNPFAFAQCRRHFLKTLYGTGLTDTVKIREQDDAGKTCELERKGSVRVPVELSAKNYTWFVIE